MDREIEEKEAEIETQKKKIASYRTPPKKIFHAGMIYCNLDYVS